MRMRGRAAAGATPRAGVRRGALAERRARATSPRPVAVAATRVVDVVIPASLPAPARALAIPPLAVMGIGSWPRPRWMLQAIHEHIEGRLDDAEFEATAQDAVRLAVDAQLRAGVDVVTDGEQRQIGRA